VPGGLPEGNSDCDDRADVPGLFHGDGAGRP
jgi:hypothetical protein